MQRASTLLTKNVAACRGEGDRRFLTRSKSIAWSFVANNTHSLSDHKLVQDPVQHSVKSQQALASKRLQRLFCATELSKSVGDIVELDTEESKYAARVLRLPLDTEVELYNGLGSLVTGKITHISKSSLSVTTIAAVQQVPWQGCKWEIAVACGTLQGSRADWLVEKCTELGAWSLRPLITERSPGVGWKGMHKAASKSQASEASSRYNRWERVAHAATKQSLRLHKLTLQPATTLQDFVPLLKSADVALVAAAGGAPVHNYINRGIAEGILVIGPEGDFTMSELEMLTSNGAALVGLGSNRLRVETAAIALLSAAQVLTC